jgi:asparagine N-glycosylation enzyme membrane subunit Stt3
MSNGWIKIHRQILEWEWYDEPNVMRLFLHLLLKANHKDKSYRGNVIKKGTLLTGRDLLAKETGLSIQQIRTAINKLKSTNEITIKTNKQGSVIQIVKYAEYQILTNKVTNKQPDSNQQLTTNKNVKKEKKLVYRSFDHLSITVEDVRKLDKEYTKKQIDYILDAIENYAKNKSYTSLYLTAKKWLAKEYPKPKEKIVIDPNEYLNR